MALRDGQEQVTWSRAQRRAPLGAAAPPCGAWERSPVCMLVHRTDSTEQVGELCHRHVSGVFSARARPFRYHRPSSGTTFWCLSGKERRHRKSQGAVRRPQLSQGRPRLPLPELFTLAVLLASGPGAAETLAPHKLALDISGGVGGGW